MRHLTSARREIDKAWRSFVIDQRPPHGVKPEIVRSWQRAGAEWHIDPGLRRCLRSVDSNDLLARAEAEEAFRITSPLLGVFADRLAPDGHALAYCDAEGVTLALQGSGRTIERLADINLAPGACWAEDATGTNGIGTALVEGRPVEVFASEHFVEAWQHWSCASAPVRAAGRVVGVVDITSPWEAHNASLLVCAEALARAIEARLDEAAAHRAEIIRGALLEKGGRSAWLAVDLHGKIVGTGPASTLGGCDPSAVGDSALAPLLAQLRRVRPTGEFEQVLDVAGRPLRIVCSRVEHEGRTVGGVLRVDVATPARAKPVPSSAHTTQRTVPIRVVARRKKDLVFLDPDEIWAFEAADRLTFVHSRQGKFDVDLSLAAIEASFGRALTRVHRNWLVKLESVRSLERDCGEMTLFLGSGVGSDGIRVPVSAHCAKPVRDALLRDSTGLRRFERDVGRASGAAE
jgi:hypothetical protein